MPLAAVDERNRFAQHLFAPLPERYDRLAEVLSMGQNGRWRRAMVDRITAGGARGTPGARPPARSSSTSRRAPPGSPSSSRERHRRHGHRRGPDRADAAPGPPQRGRRRPGRPSIGLVTGRAEQLPFADDTFDALTFTYLLRYVDDPQATLAELARVVKPGGTVASLEFLAPPAPFWRFWWWLYTRLLLPAGGLLTGGREWYRGRPVPRARTSPGTTGATRWPGRRTPGARPACGTSGSGSMSLGGGLVMWGTRAGD